MPASTARHETRALLRAHLAAASGYRHLTRHCPICHRLLRLAMESVTAPQPPYVVRESGSDPRPPGGPQGPVRALRRTEGRTPAGAGPGGGTQGRKSPHDVTDGRRDPPPPVAAS
ncbi:DUF6274 family protein [Streptomyces sp. NBC_01754]|uniref:DUF6274 family protein n=1 Tax=Streptomyces sp. NBC_01754 TaxID=2975930 RepID=UPI002DDA4E6F|nr:DUF6274 family protein [Streptomyces sp. NBC_01754]WSC93838.1 DUF6274 family protein [Streptomyces sp. NBC_01754]